MKRSTLFKITASVFLCLIVMNAFISSSLAKKIIENINATLKLQTLYRWTLSFESPFNAHVAQKNILSRNIFNVTGILPQEDLEAIKNENNIANFDKAPCAPSTETLPVELLGIVYTGKHETNLVTVKDPDVENADVYHEGDKILDYEAYSVYRVVNPTSVEFRYDNKKICRALVSNMEGVVQNGNNASASVPEPTESVTAEIVLTPNYVQSELGEGLSKIVNSARITPSVVDGKIDGFKIFAIEPGSIFEKIGLMNGDVVTQVNGNDLTDPAKGIMIYDVFQNSNENTFTVKRGETLLTRKVLIK